MPNFLLKYSILPGQQVEATPDSNAKVQGIKESVAATSRPSTDRVSVSPAVNPRDPDQIPYQKKTLPESGPLDI